MLVAQVVINPCDKVIFECPLDQLMKKVGCDELVNVGSWKVIRERLDVVL